MKNTTTQLYFCMRDGTVISQRYIGNSRSLKNRIKTIAQQGFNVRSVLTPHYEPAKMRKIVTVTNQGKNIVVTKTYIKKK